VLDVVILAGYIPMPELLAWEVSALPILNWLALRRPSSFTGYLLVCA